MRPKKIMYYSRHTDGRRGILSTDGPFNILFKGLYFCPKESVGELIDRGQIKSISVSHYKKMTLETVDSLLLCLQQI